MNSDIQIRNRRAIEALRNGVPNRDAVMALGCDQPHIEERFRQQLQNTKLSVKDGLKNEGILVAGDFGTGKSHLLEYLMHIALEENFVCSKIVISKETPLFDPVKLYRAAAEAGIVPGKRGNAMTEIATALKIESERYANFYQWANRASDLNSRFPATLFLFERVQNDHEFLDRIIRFWSGEKIGATEIRRYLRACREPVTYKIENISVKDLALQRFKFAARLIAAAGYAGWVLLIDEVELIRCYSFLQRAKSYSELARWMGKLEGYSFSGITCVLTLSDDFESKIISVDGRNDLDIIPGKLRARMSESDLLLASQAERGMRVIREIAMPLKGPNSLDQTYQKIREIYKAAYEWEPPFSPSLRLTSTRMREYIKSWITEWDLKRLDTEYIPDIEVESLSQTYGEDRELETETEEASDT